jgi:hypothetical protein
MVKYWAKLCSSAPYCLFEGIKTVIYILSHRRINNKQSYDYFAFDDFSSKMTGEGDTLIISLLSHDNNTRVSICAHAFYSLRLITIIRQEIYATHSSKFLI